MTPLLRDRLFLLHAPFQDPKLEGAWYCHDCAAMEGALLANPHWSRFVDVRRLRFPRPRRDIVALIGEENQGMPVLVVANVAEEPVGSRRAGGFAFLTDPRAIARYLAATYGGAEPHP